MAGVTRTICMDRQFGSGAITQGIVVVQPGAAVLPHTHLVEDSVTVLNQSQGGIYMLWVLKDGGRNRGENLYATPRSLAGPSPLHAARSAP